MAQCDPEVLEQAILSSGLLQVSSRSERSRLIGEIAAAHAVSSRTIRRRLDGLTAPVADGHRAPGRLRSQRRDAGSVRSPREVYGAFVKLHFTSTGKVLPESRRLSIPQLRETLTVSLPDPSLIPSDTTLLRWQAALLRKLDNSRPPTTVDVEAPNLQWLVDLSTADFWCLHPRSGEPFRPTLYACLDGHSRVCLWAQYTTSQDAFTVGGCLYHSVYPQGPEWPVGGVPRALRMDWGKQFTSEHLTQLCGALGIQPDYAPPYYPQGKGKVERFIGTLHRGAEKRFPGYCTANNQGEGNVSAASFRRGNSWICPWKREPLWSLDQANAALRDWIVGSYHQTVHSSLGCSPLEAWLRAPGARYLLEGLPSEDYIRQRLLPGETRVVHRSQVRIFDLFFRDPVLNRLASYNGMEVQVRYCPDDLRSVWVYQADRLVCECELSEPMTVSYADPSLVGHQRMKRAARSRRDGIDEIKRALRESELPGDTIEEFRRAAAEAPAAAVAGPTFRDPDEPDPDLEGVTINGIPLQLAANDR